MPRVNIYIRNEDWEAWEAIKDKPEFIHNSINVKKAYTDLSPEERKKFKSKLVKAVPVTYTSPISSA